MTKQLCIVDGVSFLGHGNGIEALNPAELNINSSFEKRMIVDRVSIPPLDKLCDWGYRLEISTRVDMAVAAELLKLEAGDSLVFISEEFSYITMLDVLVQKGVSVQMRYTSDVDLARDYAIASATKYTPVKPHVQTSTVEAVVEEIKHEVEVAAADVTVVPEDKPVKEEKVRVLRSFDALSEATDKNELPEANADMILASYLGKKRKFKQLSIEEVAVKTQKMSPCNMLDATAVKMIEATPSRASNAQILGYLRATGIDDRAYFQKALGLGVEHHVCEQAQAIIDSEVNVDKTSTKTKRRGPQRSLAATEQLLDKFTVEALLILKEEKVMSPKAVWEAVNLRTRNHLCELGVSFKAKWVKFIRENHLTPRGRGIAATWTFDKSSQEYLDKYGPVSPITDEPVIQETKETIDGVPVTKIPENAEVWTETFARVTQIPTLSEMQWEKIFSGELTSQKKLEQLFRVHGGDRNKEIVEKTIIRRAGDAHKAGLCTHNDFEMILANVKTYFLLDGTTIRRMKEMATA